MNRLLIVLSALMTLLSGCARLPDILPAPVSSAVKADPFAAVYPSGRWQLYHTIDAKVPGGEIQHLVGVAVISSDAESIEWALMTLEGLVLFSGRDNGAGILTVNRAVAPFDRQGFAEGLMADLRLLFFQPQSPPRQTGILSNGAWVKRFQSKDHDTIDLIVEKDGRWTLHQYVGAKIACTVAAGDVLADETTEGAKFAQTLTLNRPGLLGYRLAMRLVEARRLK